MIYTRGTDQDGKPISIDTDAPEVKRRVAWVADMAGLAYPALRETLNVSPNVSGGNVSSGNSLTLHAAFEFEHKGEIASVDVFAFDDVGLPATDMPGVLAYLNVMLGLGLTDEAIRGMRYLPPPPPETAHDWQAPDSPMAEPLANQTGRYKSRGTGRKVGDIWTGPSGTKYQLQNIGGIFQYLAWVRL